ncbi:MAG: prolyl oligopeptidase family serine peptidase [Pseudoruegeria sp.]
MTRPLNYERVAAPSGTTKSVVVFVHGYGANGADLLGLSDPLKEHMPDTTFVSPDAPEKIPGAPFGFQWFPIPWLDGSSEEAAKEGLARASEDFNAFLDQVMAEEGITSNELILFGFSQGTMLSLHVAPRRNDQIRAIVAFSGRLLEPDSLASDVVSKPPVLLVHGDADDVVPPQSMNEAGQALQAAGFDVYAHVMKGTAHGIAPDGLSVALSFMKDKLSRP